MEPFSALALAGNIVQFIDFGCSLISESHDIYRRGVSARYVDLRAVSEDLSELSDSFSTSSLSQDQSRREREEGLREIAFRCKVVADELLRTLDSLTAKTKPHRKWTSFRQALMVIWKKEKIDGLEHRLDELRGQLNIRILSILR
jgi:hypothetical protein